VNAIRPVFVDEVPEHLDEGTLYISIPYTTAIHLCCCGCRTQVVTPIRPARWHLFFDGETVTLTPSIGNWGFPCRSHYWIKENHIRWAGQLSAREIAALRADQRTERSGEPLTPVAPAERTKQRASRPLRILRWLIRH
jgi:hypothetical protein